MTILSAAILLSTPGTIHSVVGLSSSLFLQSLSLLEPSMPKTRGRRSSLGRSTQSRSSTRPTTRSQPDSQSQGQVDASGSQTTSQSQQGVESKEQMPILSHLLDLIRSEVRREVDQRTTSLPPVTGMVVYLFMYVCRSYIWCIICMTVYWCTNLLIEHGGRRGL